MSLSHQFQNYIGMQGALSGLGAQYASYTDRYEPIETVLNRKRVEAEQALAARQQELVDINAAIDVVTDHPHIAKLINVLRKVGL